MAVDFEIQRNAVVVDGRFIRVLHANLDGEAHFQILTRQRLEADHVDVYRITVGKQRTGAERQQKQ